MPLSTPKHHKATSSLYPLQFRKVWKKLILLEIAADPKSRGMWRSIFSSLFAVAMLYVLLGYGVAPRPPENALVFFAPVLALFGGLVLLLVVYEWLYLWTYYYDIGEHFIKIRKGVVIRREITIPYGRIQDVYVDQDVLDRLFMLYDVHMATATDISEVEAHIDGLSRRNAEIVRDLLLKQMEEANHPQAPV